MSKKIKNSGQSSTLTDKDLYNQPKPLIIQVDPFDYVVFGGTGDLAQRKLYPALFFRELDGQLPDEASIIGVARSKRERKAFIETVKQACLEHVPEKFWDAKIWDRFADRLHYVDVDLATLDGYDKLGELLDKTGDRKRVFYLALAPSLFGPVAKFLNDAKLNTPDSRVVLEKPIGNDLQSSQKINAEVGAYFKEEQIYRIDHYLGKETVQNLLALRFGNILFEQIWRNSVIDYVQITVSEDLGLGDRAGYYDKAGAMRDMVQNHILQLLCLTAMEAPASVDANAVRDEKVKVLNSLRPFKPEDVKTYTVRGQYAAGSIGGEAVPSYKEELGGESQTETFVAIQAYIDNWRWAGVPFFLRTGKRLKKRFSEIVIHFKEIPHSAFPDDSGSIKPNRLVLNLQPDEGVRMELMTKVPGPGGMRLQSVPLDLSFRDEFELQRFPDAYERLLLDVVRGNSTLFMRGDEVEAAWKWVEPIIQAWQTDPEKPKSYSAGTWGPSASANLIDRSGRAWYEDDS